MKQLLFITFFILPGICPAQSDSLEFRARHYFEQVRSATEKNIDLWGINLYGPMILVNPSGRKVYANEPDLEGQLTESNGIFVGTFPKSLNISGTYIHWGGKTWAMLPYLFPPNATIEDIVGYLGHELFHRSQKTLGFVFPNEILNDHLDEKEGRIYLRLELKALQAALEEPSEELSRARLSDALLFRMYRYKIYPQAKEKENLLELNEGITQYTTVILRGRTYDSTVANLKKAASIFLNGPTYVRTFAYHTIPAYGMLLNKRNRSWNRVITMQTNLADFFIQNFEIYIPENLDSALKAILPQYNGAGIIAEEEARQKRLIEEKERFKETLLGKPHLEIAISRK